MTDWMLENVEDRARTHPGSFFIPSSKVRRLLSEGDVVKLVFVRASPSPGEPSAERMWVEIINVGKDDGSYTGKLLNQPSHIDSLAAGAEVEFRSEHVASVGTSTEDLGYNPDQVAIVSRRLTEKMTHPGYLRRDEPIGGNDSGWQVFSGDESDEYFSDRSNFGTAALGLLSDKFPGLDFVFRTGKVGETWMWDESEMAYRCRE